MKAKKQVFKVTSITVDGVEIPVLKLIDEEEVDLTALGKKVKNIEKTKNLTLKTQNYLDLLANTVLKESVENEVDEGTYIQYSIEQGSVVVRVGAGGGLEGRDLSKWPSRLLRVAVLKAAPKGEVDLEKLNWYEPGKDIFIYEGRPKGEYSALIFVTEDGTYVKLSEKALESEIGNVELEEQAADEEEEE